MPSDDDTEKEAIEKDALRKEKELFSDHAPSGSDETLEETVEEEAPKNKEERNPLTKELLKKRNISDVHTLDEGYKDPLDEDYLIEYHNTSEKTEHTKLSIVTGSRAASNGWNF